jgi:hypothetical protein
VRARGALVLGLARHRHPGRAVDEPAALAHLEHPHQHVARVAADPLQLDRHARDHARVRGVVGAHQLDLALADQRGLVVGGADLEPHLGADRLGRAGRDEHAEPGDLRREPLDEGVEIGVAHLDAEHRRGRLALVCHRRPIIGRAATKCKR